MGKSAIAAMAVLAAALEAHAASVTLGDCVQAALQRAPAIQAAESANRAAGARVDEARGAYLPTVIGIGEYGRSRGLDSAVTNGGATTATVRAEATLLDAGTRRAQLLAAKAQGKETGAEGRRAEASVVRAVTEAYASALFAQAEAATDLDAARRLEEYRSLLAAQERLGTATRNDSLRARIAAENARAAAESARLDGDRQRAELALLTGLDLTAPDLVEPPDSPPPDLGDASVDEIPAVAAAAAALETARREADARAAERWGQLTASADAGFLGIRPGPTFGENGGADFLVGLRIPLFDAPAAARRTAARIEVDRARALLDQARESARLALGRARAGIDRAEIQLASARALAPLAEDNFTLLRARALGGGDTRVLDVLDGLTQLVEARRGIARAALDVRLAHAAAAEVLGETTP